MKLGFTGTRHGMTAAQKREFAELIKRMRPAVFRHGSCQGADVQAAQIVFGVYDFTRIVCHPGPDGDSHRQASGVDDETLPGKTHFARNRAIVDATDALVACPCDMAEQARGGTWYTVGYARKKGKRLWIIWPDGTVTEEATQP